MGEIEMLENRVARLERELAEIKNFLTKLEIMLISEEEIDEESKRILEKRLKEVLSGNAISLEELQREI